MKRVVLLILICFSLLSVTGCSSNKAEELYEIAQFEELQNNKEHAQELYEEIIGKYPGSDFARKAEERLSEIGGK
jgi:TolA-binding protein